MLFYKYYYVLFKNTKDIYTIILINIALYFKQAAHISIS